MEMKKEITWEIKDGKKAMVEIALILSRVLNADGHKVRVPCCEIGVIATVEGSGCVGTGRPSAVNQQGCVARIGKLGIPADQLAEIKAAIAEIEATPEWQAKIDRQKKSEKEGREYEAHREMMRKVMGY